jgi:hypothetical protein
MAATATNKSREKLSVRSIVELRPTTDVDHPACSRVIRSLSRRLKCSRYFAGAGALAELRPNLLKNDYVRTISELSAAGPQLWVVLQVQ